MAICGYRTGMILDTSRSNWLNDAHRPIAWSAWYPTEDYEADERPEGQFFDLGDVVFEAQLAPRETFPVILLSHGTGGTAESLGWLARALAAEGHVVLGANHHGNTGLEPYLPEGFLCWWDRATDLSNLLTALGSRGFFANRLDFDHVSAVGFSLGGHTVLALSGARTSLDVFDTWRRDNKITAGGPKEFPDAADSIPRLMESSDAFRKSWARHHNDYSDHRVSAVVAIAPAPPIRAFVPTSLSDLRLPVVILTGGADQEAPSEQCADWLLSQNDRFDLHCLGSQVGHYTFLDFPTDTSLIGTSDFFSDHESVDRGRVHQQASDIVIQSLRTVDSERRA